MRVWDTELLRQKKTAELVTDGLIMWIDGRDGFGSNYSIHERVTNTNLSLTINRGGGILAWGGQYLIISTSNIYGGYSFNGAASKTIEFVVRAETVSAYACDYQYSGGNVFVRNSGASTAPYAKVRKKTDLSSMEGFYLSNPIKHIVVRENSITINGVLYASPSALCTTIDTVLRLNSTSDNIEHIGAIRAYNRELTDAEIAQNLEYEKSIGRVVL